MPKILRRKIVFGTVHNNNKTIKTKKGGDGTVRDGKATYVDTIRYMANNSW